jgi:SAM-dependent methyltransferase
VEVNPAAAALAQGHDGLRVETGDFDSTTFSEESFDAVSIFHTLDQLADPLGALRRIRRFLVPGGLLVVTVPNIRSFMVWALGSRHRHFTPEKGMSFTPTTLHRMVREAGFEILRLETFGEEPTPSNLAELIRTRGRVDLFERRASLNGLGPGPHRGSLLRAHARSLTRLLIRLTRAAGLGSYMTLYARSDPR